MKKSTLALLIILAFGISNFSQTVKIQVYPEILKQKIPSIGGNYCQANYTDNAWDKIGEATLADLKPSHVRIALPLNSTD